jgi:hypothetical protein
MVRSRSVARRLLGPGLALTVGLLALTISAPPARAASPELTLVTDARYVVDPDNGRVRVTVDITATNHKPDTTTRRYFFDQAYLAVLPGTTGFAVSAAGPAPTVRVTERAEDHTMLRLGFGTKLLSGRSLDLRLTFDLPDPGGPPARDVRIGQALTQFPIWAFGSDGTPGSTVEVVFPAGYAVSFASGSIPGPLLEDGAAVYRTGPLAEPTGFFAYVVADREGAYVGRSIEVPVGEVEAQVEVRAWADDPAFGERIGDLFSQGLPRLGEAIGLDYPWTEPLVVEESVSRSLGGYAGLFDPGDGGITVDYAAPSYVVLHEAAHVWFNGDLLADRWANEAFASYYAGRVGTALGLPAGPAGLTPELGAARIPLNAWGEVGRAEDATESYAYAASLALAELVAQRAGDDGLAEVWSAAAARRSAYQPVTEPGPVELVDGPPDWRGLLDLLEESTDRRFDDLWRGWVIRESDRAILDTRGSVRALYAATLEQAADWELPSTVRAALAAWRFDAAAGQLAQADAVLDQRDEIADRSDALGLTPPDTLEEVFEGRAGLRAAGVEADAELAAIDAYVAALGSRLLAPGPIEQLGLVGSEPALDLAAARAAFAEGSLAVAVAAADEARAAWETADEVGLRRALTLAVGLLLAGMVGLLVALGVRGRRVARFIAVRRRPTVPMAHRAGRSPVRPVMEDRPGG